MSAQVKYNEAMAELIGEHFGTLKEFAEQMKICHVTAGRYLRNPEKMQVRFVRLLAKKIGSTTCKIISEGEE